MDLKWERATPKLDLSIDTIQLMIGEYENKYKIKDYMYLSGGCINHNYKIRLSNDECLLLRIVHNEQGYKNEIAISNSILSQNLNIPKLYYYGEHNNYLFIIYEFIHGKLLTNLLNTENKQNYIKQAAKSAAIIHKHTKDDVEGIIDIALDLPPFNTWYDLFMSNEYVKEVLSMKKLDAIKNILTKNDNILQEIEKKKSLTHSDYRPSNMIVDNKGVLYIIDWQSPMTTHLVTDIGQFFRYDSMFSETDKLVFMNEYNKISNTKISLDDYICADFRDLVNYLQLLGNCKNKPNMRSNMVGLIDSFINNYSFAFNKARQ